MRSGAVARWVVSELSYIGRHTAGVAELLGRGKTPTRLVARRVRSEALGGVVQKDKMFPFQNDRPRS